MFPQEREKKKINWPNVLFHVTSYIPTDYTRGFHFLPRINEILSPPLKVGSNPLYSINKFFFLFFLSDTLRLVWGTAYLWHTRGCGTLKTHFFLVMSSTTVNWCVFFFPSPTVHCYDLNSCELFCPLQLWIVTSSSAVSRVVIHKTILLSFMRKVL